MGNAFRVFKRDVLRLVRTPAAMVVIVALLILPSAYTWYNVVGFWNPYEHTGDLRVCVVNEDAGGSSDITGQLDVGDMIVDKLHENDQLQWVFTDHDDALDQVTSGKAYAAFIIPEDFTKKLLTITTGTLEKPELDYYVNEKLGPVSPKITDTGASTLEETVNSTFVSTVSDVAAETIDKAFEGSEERTAELKSEAAAKIDHAREMVTTVRADIGSAQAQTASAQDRIKVAQGKLDGAQAKIESAASSLEEIAGLLSELRQAVSDASAKTMPAINAALTDISQASSRAHAQVGALSQSIGSAQGDLAASLSQARAIVSDNEAMIQQLSSLQQSMSDGTTGKAELGQMIAQLQSTNESLSATIDQLEEANGNLTNIVDEANTAADELDRVVQSATADAQHFSEEFYTNTLPKITSSLDDLSRVCLQASSAIGGQKALITQAKSMMDRMAETASTASEALGQTDALFASLEEGLSTVGTDLMSLSLASGLADMLGVDGLDAQKIADFMGSPANLVTKQLYELNAYGSAMAPLFMNLTLWIGAFMLMVILRQEVDSEGIKRLTLTQRYLGRFFLLAVLVVIQAIVCCTGLIFIGVEAVSWLALYVASIVAALAYLSIIYSLSVTLQHIGKGLCIILVFAQIPGATGLYPIEMTSPFFQVVYPALPFTYGINAMREAICGFYGSQYASMLGVLAVFFAISMAFGIFVRPWMANVNRMVARQIRQSGIFNGEDVEIPVRRFRFSQIMRALSEKEEYRSELVNRYERLMRHYPRLIRGAIVFGVGVPVVLILLVSLTPTEKVILLTLFLGWFLLLVLFLIIVESLRSSIERQLKLDDMSDEELRSLYAARNKVGDAEAGTQGGEGA